MSASRRCSGCSQTNSPRHFLLPLPPGVEQSEPRSAGLLSSTSSESVTPSVGRLRVRDSVRRSASPVSSIPHPPLSCEAFRTVSGIVASAHAATQSSTVAHCCRPRLRRTSGFCYMRRSHRRTARTIATSCCRGVRRHSAASTIVRECSQCLEATRAGLSQKSRLRWRRLVCRSQVHSAYLPWRCCRKSTSRRILLAAILDRQECKVVATRAGATRVRPEAGDTV